MKTTIKLTSLLLSVFLVLAPLTGCSSDDDNDYSKKSRSSSYSGRETEPQKVAMAVICACIEGDNITAAKYLPEGVNAADVGWDEPDPEAGTDRGKSTFYPFKDNGTVYTDDDLEDYLDSKKIFINNKKMSKFIDISMIEEIRTYGFGVRFEDSSDEYYCETCSGLIDGVWYIVSYTGIWY